MAKESDAFAHSFSSTKTWEAVTWGQTMVSAPDIAMIAAISDKKKCGVESGTSTTTGCNAGAEINDVYFLIKESGYEDDNGAHPEFDSGSHTISTSKSYESQSFNSTFAAAPHVDVTHNGSTAGGKKTSVDSITTTGCNVASEETGNVYWTAVAAGFFQP